ncbi:MAG: hypothetical protein ABIQ76_03000 [Candidatus Limnocylindrales bacterium]
MPDVSLGLLFVVASASIFGPLSAWLAGQRMRNMAVWGIFGIILGPIAPGLLVSAPPGRCAACRWPVGGWGRRCVACGADVRSGSVWVTDSALPAGASELARAGMGPLVNQLSGPPTHLGNAAPTAAVLGGTVAGQAWSSRVAPTELGHRPVDALPVGSLDRAGGEHENVAITTLGSGVYVGGNRRMQTGNRYLLARDVEELQILGPVHLDPATIADRVPLAAIEAFFLEERLIIGSRDSSTDIAMAFVALSLQQGMDIVAALGSPRSAAPPE